MLPTWPAHRDRVLVDALRGERDVPDAAAPELFARAEAHGLGDVLFDDWSDVIARVDRSLHDSLALRRRAREMEHDAHLAMLARIDEALGRASLRAVALKGPLLAQRIYSRPAARGATDIDLLVREVDLEAVVAATTALGYSPEGGPHAAFFRREHHHITLVHPHALPLELHFHAIRAFGGVIRSEPLIERSVPHGQLEAVRVLGPEDELVYLTLHAAWHRFGRIAWLHDLALLVAKMTDDQLAEAARRARELGFGRVLAFAATLLADASTLPRERLALLGRLSDARVMLVAGVTNEPAGSLLRSATRFVYAASLCDSLPHAARYAGRASRMYAERALGRAP